MRLDGQNLMGRASLDLSCIKGLGALAVRTQRGSLHLVMPKRKEQTDASRVNLLRPPCTAPWILLFSLALCQPDARTIESCFAQLPAEVFAQILPTLLEEVARSTTVVYDASSYARADDAVQALLLGSGTVAELTERYGKHYGRPRIYWALVIALIEAHQDKAVPVMSFGNGIINEYGRKLFGREEQAWSIYRKEGWTIWDNGFNGKKPHYYLQKEQSADGKWWYLTPLGCGRKVLTRLRVRLSARPCPW